MIFTEDHAPLFTATISDWKLATKTKSIKAKAIASVITDSSIRGKVLITTLEGNESLEDECVICLGSIDEIWQQLATRLLNTYTIESIDKDGWMICVPKPDNRIQFFQWNSKIITKTGEHFIKALRGEPFRTYGLCQRFRQGDYICRSLSNPDDVWIVRQELFKNTYTIIS